MTFFNNIRNRLVQASLYTGKSNARRQLMAMSDRQLEDFGISRKLLMSGVAAWPWRLESEVSSFDVAMPVVPAVQKVAQGSQDDRAIKVAINELNAYSDRELAELGLTRHSIDEAVRYGRPAVEGIFENSRSAA